MSKVRVAGFGLSLDGFSAGIEQNLDTQGLIKWDQQGTSRAHTGENRAS